MGIFDRFLGRKAAANPTQALPLPLSQSRDIYLTGYGSGQLQTLLRRALPVARLALRITLLHAILARFPRTSFRQYLGHGFPVTAALY